MYLVKWYFTVDFEILEELLIAVKSFSINLRNLMKKAGLNQVQLANKSGVKQQYLSRYLSENVEGKLPRSLETLVSLCKALDCSLYELTGLRSLRSVSPTGRSNLNLSAEALSIARQYEKLSTKDPKRVAIKRLLRLQ